MNYMILETSTGQSYKFKAVSMKPILERAETVAKTAGGKLDVALGETLKGYNYSIRCPHQTNEVGFGTYNDLVELMLYNDPNGSPNCFFEFTDHYGTYYPKAMILGKTEITLLTTIIEGYNAHYLVPLNVFILEEA